MNNIFKIIVLVPILFLLACNKKERNFSTKKIYKQKIEGKIWKVSYLIGEETSDKKIKFIQDSSHNGRIYGLLANFTNNKFESRNVSKCGNDYFTHIYGKYKFYDQDKIMISLDSITFSGEWEKPTLYKNGEEIDYLISKDGNNILFTKIE